MTKRRFTQWIVLACMGTLAACTSGTGDTAGNTELNILVPDGGADNIDIGTVEYTIHCLGNETPGFLDNNASFDEEVTINGNLEVVDGQTSPNGSIPPEFGVFRPGDGAEIWQGFMDLPPGACTIQLRARDNDGEVICTATEPFNIVADATSKVNLVLICDISFQAPVGMLDVDATFSFNVGNFCPDLFVLNCVESNPVVPFPGAPPTTYCETRFRDGDSTCGTNCDPQTCVVTTEGLTCTPGPDPGVSTTVTCDQLLDCEGDLIPDASCTWAGDTTGAVGAGIPVPVLLGGPGPDPGGFFTGCAIDGAGNPLTPGLAISCTAVTTDGDIDCDKTKVVSYNCPGANPCTTPPFPGACDDANDCTGDVCDPSTGSAVCSNPNSPAGTICVAVGGGLCDGAGTCVPQGCLNDNPDCNVDGNPCTVGAPGTCVAGACTLPEVAGNDGGACDSGSGSGIGLCSAGSCVSQDTCLTAGDCDDSDQCTDDVCSGSPLACSNPNSAAGTSCDAGGGPGSGACDGAGTCAAPPVIDPSGLVSTASQALPKVALAGTCVYDSVTTTCSGCVQDGTLTAPGGGDCAAFGIQEFEGCEVPGGVLNSQLAIDVTILLELTSDGANNITHDFTVTAINPALVPAAGLVTVDAASLFASVTGATPSQIQNDLNPAFAGQPLGAFTGGLATLLLDDDPGTGIGDEIPTVTTALTPTVPAGGNVSFNYDTFSLTLTIVATGAPLTVDDAGCVFDIGGPDIVIGVN